MLIDAEAGEVGAMNVVHITNHVSNLTDNGEVVEYEDQTISVGMTDDLIGVITVVVVQDHTDQDNVETIVEDRSGIDKLKILNGKKTLKSVARNVLIKLVFFFAKLKNSFIIFSGVVIVIIETVV